MVSDLKSGVVMTSSQRRPNVHLMGNPAVKNHGSCQNGQSGYTNNQFANSTFNKYSWIANQLYIWTPS